MNATTILLAGGVLYFLIKRKTNEILSKINVQILKINFEKRDGLNAIILLQVANPLLIPVTIQDYQLSLKLSGSSIANGVNFVAFKLNPRSKTNIPIELKISALYVAELIELIAKKEVVKTVQIVGTLKTSAGTFSINENFNFDFGA